MDKVTSGTKIIEMEEIKAPHSVKAKDATDKWEQYLGGGIYSSMNPIKGNDPDRIFSEDGSRCIRFSHSEMNTLNKDDTVRSFITMRKRGCMILLKILLQLVTTS